jgi:hypothetical protein
MNIQFVSAEDLPNGIFKHFAQLFATNDSSQLIQNVQTTFKILKVGENLYFPITINEEAIGNSFVCSPFTTYVLYAKDELLHKIHHKWVQMPLLWLIKGISKWLRWGQIDKNIHVNNFLLSTNPYPIWDGAGIEAITDFLKKNYPNHAIIFKSLNEYQHSHLLSQLEQKDYKLVGSRQLYIVDLDYKDWLKRDNNKNDNRLIRNKKLNLLEHEAMGNHLETALILYKKLYLEKYSMHNPQFSLAYFKACHVHKILYFQGYTDNNNELKAFSATFVWGDTITSPLIGYDTSAPQKDNLYIHAAQLAVLYKFKHNLLLNLSSGAPGFKRMRGAEPSIEYSAVYLNHLPKKRQITWQILRFFSNRIGVPLIKKYKL